MLGYKGIQYINGILRAKAVSGDKGDIFEIGVPKQKVEIDEGIAFSENGYSFCGRIEEVLPWEDFCEPLKNRTLGVDSRLFLIDTLDSKVTGSSKHYKAEQIVVLREITYDEIVKYFTEHSELRTRISEELWDLFCEDGFENYKLKIDSDEINRTLIKNCLRLEQKSMCKQDSEDYVLSKCEECEGSTWNGDVFYDLTDYYYLHARRKLYEGMHIEDIEEYHKLQGCQVEQDNLRLLESWIRKTRNIT